MRHQDCGSVDHEINSPVDHVENRRSGSFVGHHGCLEPGTVVEQQVNQVRQGPIAGGAVVQLAWGFPPELDESGDALRGNTCIDGYDVRALRHQGDGRKSFTTS